MPARPASRVTGESPFAGLFPAIALAGFVFAAGTVSFYAPPAIGEMAVVFPFGTDPATSYRLILAEGGRFVAGSQFGNILIAYAPDAGFAARIRGAGALATLAAHGLCAPAPASSSEV